MVKITRADGIAPCFCGMDSTGVASLRLPGQELPEINNLMEVDAMLAERVKEWTYEWKAEGVQLGRQEGEVGFLLRQMRVKFGELTPATIATIQAADIAQLQAWSERIFSATTVEELLQA